MICIRLRNLKYIFTIFGFGMIIFLARYILTTENDNIGVEERETRRRETEFVMNMVLYPQESLTILQENKFATDWTEVLDSDKKLFIYSAYYDTRQNESYVVRIVSIIQKGFKVNRCEIYTSNNEIIETRAVVKIIREGWNLLYSAAFITCYFPPSTKDEIPLYVWPKLGQYSDIQTYLPVIQMETRNEEGFLSVCVKPFHYEFNRAVWLVEFIEMYRILGADHFIFYNHTVGSDVEKVLNYYVDEGLVSLYQWSLPITSKKDIRTEGIFASLNDCNLRSVNRFQYSAFVDIDEFIIPRKHNNYRELLDSLGDFNAYIFQNAFFYLYWRNDTEVDDLLYGNDENLGSQLYGSTSEGPYLLTAYKTTRMSKPFPHGVRSKYIGKPDKIIECGNHIVGKYVIGKKPIGWKFRTRRKGKYINVNSEDALSHHYRICEYGGYDCLNEANEIDKTAHHWLNFLFENVAQKCKKIFPDLDKCPTAPPLGSPW